MLSCWCDYDSDGDGNPDRNWATAWQNSHTENVDWYNCSPAHSQALNGNLKAYAAWWLWARLAGWPGLSDANCPNLDNPIIVNFGDFAVLANNWQVSDSSLAGDFDNSGKVDIADLAVLLDYVLQECY